MIVLACLLLVRVRTELDLSCPRGRSSLIRPSCSPASLPLPSLLLLVCRPRPRKPTSSRRGSRTPRFATRSKQSWSQSGSRCVCANMWTCDVGPTSLRIVPANRVVEVSELRAYTLHSDFKHVFCTEMRLVLTATGRGESSRIAFRSWHAHMSSGCPVAHFLREPTPAGRGEAQGAAGKR